MAAKVTARSSIVHGPARASSSFVIDPGRRVQAGQQVLDVAQPGAHPQQQLVSQRRVPADPQQKRLARDQLGRDLGRRAHGRIARPALEHAHLADELAGAGGAEQDAVIADAAQHLDPAGLDQDDAVARIALAQQDLAGSEAPLHRRPPG